MINTGQEIKIPVSVGELIDKITILEIKKINIKDKSKLELISKELDMLFYIYNNKITNISIDSKKCQEYKEDLFIVNRKLWEIEDDIRTKEKANEFDEVFIQLARSVYYQNDKRFEIKKKINKLLGSEIEEVKSYQKYT